MATNASLPSLLWLEQTPSTNEWLKSRRFLPDKSACATLCQTDGRGRRGRTWVASKGEGLALSVLFHGALPALPLACAVAVGEALTALTGTVFAWKWPNDIVCSNRKVCGILCESISVRSEVDTVAGMGINLLQTEEQWVAASLPYAGSVAELTGKRLAPDQLANEVLQRLFPLVDCLRQEGFSAVAQAYADGCITLGREVCVQTPDGGALVATATELLPDGSLLLTAPDGHTAVFSAGEVSVRGLYGYV